MSVPKSVTTPAGTVLPLTNLKGKAYLMVAHRLQWFNEVERNFNITTEFLEINENYTVARATVVVRDDKGTVLRSAQATKRETKADFSDHTEKAETSAIGRALAILGYGTQFALADLDEGERLADSPLVATPGTNINTAPAATPAAPSEPRRATFRRPSATETPTTEAAPTEETPSTPRNNGGGWR